MRLAGAGRKRAVGGRGGGGEGERASAAATVSRMDIGFPLSWWAVVREDPAAGGWLAGWRNNWRSAVVLGALDARPGNRRLRRLSDEGLAALVARGDAAAFEALYDRHHAALLAFCRHMTGSREDGEDALQQTFLRAHRALLADRAPDAVRPWLFAIARNRCRTLLAARRPAVPAEEVEVAFDGLADDVRRRADLRELVADLGRLPEDQRGALVLHELGDLSHSEIATVIGCAPEKVKALVFQARTALVADREARATPCEEIRGQLETARGGLLRRGPLRRHLRQCAPCSSYRLVVAQQRAGLAIILPVAPSAGLKAAILGGAAATTAGGGAAAGGVAAGGGAAPWRRRSGGRRVRRRRRWRDRRRCGGREDLDGEGRRRRRRGGAGVTGAAVTVDEREPSPVRAASRPPIEARPHPAAGSRRPRTIIASSRWAANRAATTVRRPPEDRHPAPAGRGPWPAGPGSRAVSGAWRAWCEPAAASAGSRAVRESRAALASFVAGGVAPCGVPASSAVRGPATRPRRRPPRWPPIRRRTAAGAARLPSSEPPATSTPEPESTPEPAPSEPEPSPAAEAEPAPAPEPSPDPEPAADPAARADPPDPDAVTLPGCGPDGSLM